MIKSKFDDDFSWFITEKTYKKDQFEKKNLTIFINQIYVMIS